MARASTPPAEVQDQIKAVTEKFQSLGAQLSLNFGSAPAGAT